MIYIARCNAVISKQLYKHSSVSPILRFTSAPFTLSQVALEEVIALNKNMDITDTGATIKTNSNTGYASSTHNTCDNNTHSMHSKAEFRFPLALQAVGVQCSIQAGAALYIPPFWWHHVHATDDNVSVLMPFAMDKRENAAAERPWCKPGWGVIPYASSLHAASTSDTPSQNL